MGGFEPYIATKETYYVFFEKSMILKGWHLQITVLVQVRLTYSPSSAYVAMPTKPVSRILKDIEERGAKYVPKLEAWSEERKAAVRAAEGPDREKLLTVPAIRAFLEGDQEFASMSN